MGEAAEDDLYRAEVYDDFDQDDCWSCGGEGFVSSCFEEWACIDPEYGCDFCRRRCDVCAALSKATGEEG